MSIFFKGDSALTTNGYILFIGIIILLFIAIALIARHNKKLSTRELIVCAVAIALGFVTSNIKFFSLPFGGSITLFSMLFVSLVGYFYGTSTGIIACLAYGILQFIIDPYIYNPLQILLDYPLAFAALGLSGLFRNQKYGLQKGLLLGAFLRGVFHCISGYLFFMEWTPEGINPLIYPIVYNYSFISVEIVLTLVLLAIPAVSVALKKVKISIINE